MEKIDRELVSTWQFDLQRFKEIGCSLCGLTNENGQNDLLVAGPGG